MFYKKYKAKLAADLPQLIQQHLDQIESEIIEAEKAENPNDKILNLENVKNSIEEAKNDVNDRLKSIATKVFCRRYPLCSVENVSNWPRQYSQELKPLRREYLDGFVEKLQALQNNASETLSQRFIAAAIGKIVVEKIGLELPASASAAVVARLSAATI